MNFFFWFEAKLRVYFGLHSGFIPGRFRALYRMPVIKPLCPRCKVNALSVMMLLYLKKIMNIRTNFVACHFTIKKSMFFINYYVSTIFSH